MILGERLVRRPVDHRRARNHHPRLGARQAQRFEQVVRPAHIDGEGRLRAIPRAAHMGRTCAVINRSGPEPLDRLADGGRVEKIDRFPPHP